MLRIFLTVVLLILIFAFGNTAAHDGDHPYIDLEKIPFVSVGIKNNTKVFLSLTFTNALCDSQRIILKPKASFSLEKCFQYSEEILGPMYHIRAVFFDKTEVLESKNFIFSANQNCRYLIFNRSPKAPQCH